MMMQATSRQNAHTKSKSVPKQPTGRRSTVGKKKGTKKSPGRRDPSRERRPQASQLAQAQAFSPQETFQMIQDVDAKLQNKNGLFDEDAHNAKRQVLLERAALAKKRIEAQNQASGLQKKPNFEHIEDQLELERAENFLQNRIERKKEYRAKTLELAERRRRKWMVQQGKSHFLDFKDDQIVRLKECFRSLDDDGSGSIGVDEIKGPLIGLGLVDSVEEVENLVKMVDEDNSGMIEFSEFLDIILNKSGDAKAGVITQFFKNLTNGNYETNGLAFPNWVLKEQRVHLKNAIVLDKEDDRRSKGVRIMNAIKRMKDQEGRNGALSSDEEL